MGRISRGGGGRGRVALAVAISAIVVAGCGVSLGVGDLGEAVGGRPDDATAIVDRWFELARSGRDDHGWWLLHPNTRVDVIGSFDVYRDTLAKVDWSGFDYDVADVRLHDGQYKVELRVAGGRRAVPESVCRWGLIRFGGLDEEVGQVTVRIPPIASEPAGILAGGGGC